MALRVVLGGAVGIQRDDEVLVEAGPGRLSRLTLAYLTVERHRPAPRDELAEVLWGEDLPGSWDQMVRGTISSLRAMLRDYGLPAEEVLVTTHGCYQLRLPATTVVDIEEAAQRQVAAEAHLVAGDAAAALEEAQAAAGVASRQFVPGASGPWVERRQAELRELHLRCLETLAAAAEAVGQWGKAVDAAEEAIGIEPFRESAYVRLMAAHARAGHRGEALRAYDRCRRALAEELGVRPGSETEAAYLALLSDEPPSATDGALARPEPIPLPASVAAIPGTFLVGREREMERLAHALKRTDTDGRQAVLIAGEPGVGKTTLVANLAREAHAQGARVLYGRCDEELGVAYQPFAEAVGHFVAHCPLVELEDHVATHGGELTRLVPHLARRLPDVPTPPTTDPEADRFRLFEAVAALLDAASQRGPVVLVLDDLHWAAHATVLLLRHLLRLRQPAALLVIGTYRDTGVGPGHPLAAALAGLRPEPVDVDRIALEGLDEDGVAAFLEVAGGTEVDHAERSLARAIHAHTAGNPFFVGELVRHIAESGAVYRRDGRWSYYQDVDGLGVPEGVPEVVGRRLQRMAEKTNRALVMAAVIGTEFAFDVLEAVTDGSGTADLLDAMDEAVAGHLLVEVDQGRFRFSHALVRDTIYTGLTTTRRGRIHRRVGEVLEVLAAVNDSERLPALAHHFGEAASAGCALKAADYALAAARQANAQAAWEDAAALLERGLAALDKQQPPDLARRCDLLLLLAETWTRFFHPSKALTAATPAVEAARALGDSARLGQAAYWYVCSYARARRDQQVSIEAFPLETTAVAQEALAALGETMPALRAKILAEINGVPEGFDEASLQQALALARRSGDLDALGVTLSTCAARLRGSPRLHEHLALAEELVRGAPPDGWDGWRNGRSQRALGRLSAGDRRGFEEDREATERFGTERRFWYFRWLAAVWEAGLALLDGRFSEVEALAAEARAMAPEGFVGDEFFLRQVFKLNLELGDLGASRAAAAELVQRAPENPMHAAMLAIVEAQQSGVDSDRRRFETIVDQGLGPLSPERTPVTLAYRAELAVALGGVDRAAALYEAFEPYGNQVVIGGLGEGCIGAADRYLGMLAAQQGRWDDADSHYDTALGLEQGLRSPPLVARTQYWYGRMLLARRAPGDVDRATHRLVGASATAQRLGMASLAAHAATALSPQ